MKDKGKIVVWAIIVIVIIGVIVFAVVKNTNNNNLAGKETETKKEEFATQLDDGTRLNTSSKISETKKFDTFEVSGIQLTEKDNQSIILATIKNVGETASNVTLITVSVIDKTGKEIYHGDGIGIVGELQPGETQQLNVGASFDCANAYDIVFSKK